MFALHLTEKKYHDEAGLILYRAELYQEALDAFLKSSNWQMFTNICLKLKLQKNDYLEKLRILIGRNTHIFL